MSVGNVKREVNPRALSGRTFSAVGLGAAVLVSLLVLGLPFDARATSPLTVRDGATLTMTTLGVGTQVDAVDMLTSSSGYGVASATGNEKNSYFLVKTTTGASSWTVVHRVPLPTLTSHGPALIPTIDFVNSRVGYVWNLEGGLYLTKNGGATWAKLVVPGRIPTFNVSDAAVFAISEVCTRSVKLPGSQCPYALSRYRVASTRPSSTFTIPKFGSSPLRSSIVVAELSASTVIVAEGLQGGLSASPTALETTNSGQSWRRLKVPCAQFNNAQLLTTASGQWLLDCFTGEGMNQGINELSSSLDAGERWTIVDIFRPGVPTKGNMGDVAATLYLSGNQKILYGALGGASGGLEYSTDYGRRWTMVRLRDVAQLGGTPESISTFGTTGAILEVLDGALYRSTNGVKWIELPPLSSGTKSGIEQCPSSWLLYTGIAHQRRVGGTTSYTFFFQNEGLYRCQLAGIPRVQPVRGGGHSPVGPVATKLHVACRGGLVTLAPNAMASITLGVKSVLSYTAANCEGANVDGLDVQFNSPAVFYLSLPAQFSCTKVASMKVTGVVSGIKGAP